MGALPEFWCPRLLFHSLNSPVFFRVRLLDEMVSEIPLDGVPWVSLVTYRCRERSILDKRFPAVGDKEDENLKKQKDFLGESGRFHDCVKTSSKVEIVTKETSQTDRLQRCYDITFVINFSRFFVADLHEKKKIE